VARMVAEAQHLRPEVAVVSNGEEVPIAAEAGAQPWRDGQPVEFRAQQNLGGIDRAGAEDYVGRVHRELFRPPFAQVAAPMNPPAAAFELLDPFDLGLRVDLGAGVGCHRQVIHVERILGRYVASGHAVAAIDARSLKNTVLIRAVRLEVDSDIQADRFEAGLVGPPLQRLNLWKLKGAW